MGHPCGKPLGGLLGNPRGGMAEQWADMAATRQFEEISRAARGQLAADDDRHVLVELAGQDQDRTVRAVDGDAEPSSLRQSILLSGELVVLLVRVLERPRLIVAIACTAEINLGLALARTRRLAETRAS